MSNSKEAIRKSFSKLAVEDQQEFALLVAKATEFAMVNTREIEVYGLVPNQNIPSGEGTGSEGTTTVGHKLLLREVGEVESKYQFAGHAMVFGAKRMAKALLWFLENSDNGKTAFRTNARPQVNSPEYAHHRKDPFYRTRYGQLVAQLDFDGRLALVTEDDWDSLRADAEALLEQDAVAPSTTSDNLLDMDD